MRIPLSFTVLLFSIVGCTHAAGAGGTDEGGYAPLNFETLTRRDSPNDFLVCPPDHCPNAKADRAAPVFGVPVVELRRRLDNLIANQPRSRVVFSDQKQVVAEQRSTVFRFPDLIDVETIEIGPDRSTVAIYSRSKYGYYDFGVNEQRVDSWLQELAARPE